MALITLIRRSGGAGGRPDQVALAALGVFGASLFFGDSMITPAISVLSAVEGLKVVEPSLEHLVVPITAAIIVVLFVVQRLGTAAVGRLFGPVMIVWFLDDRRAAGRRDRRCTPRSSRRSRRPTRVDFLFGHFATAFFSLAAVVLAVTGAEALYADMGHFGRPPITRAWLLLVFPACILSYLGQGALILADPRRIGSPFFLLVPDWAADPDGLPRHRGDGDRLAGRDHRRLLGRAPGRPARLPAAPADRRTPPSETSARSTSRGSTGPAGRRADARLRVPDLGQARLRLRHGRDRARSRSRRCCSSTSSATSGSKPLWLVAAGRRPAAHGRPRCSWPPT